MKFHVSAAMLALLAPLSLSAQAQAQAQNLPSELNGRWTFAARNVTQTFSLKGIEKKGEDAFEASLTWWTTDPKCVVRSAPISGRLLDNRLTFDATTRCDVAFTVDLQRQDDGWRGTARTKAGPEVTLELQAR